VVFFISVGWKPVPLVQLNTGYTILFDLTIFPLSLDTGREQYELPGLLVVSAPRKAARMRAQDHLVLYCKLHTIAGGSAAGVDLAQSGTAITQLQLKEILSRLSDTYFTFSGSITAGLRIVAARLNDFLLNRNLKAAQEGQTVGKLNMAVIHGDRLVVAHAGATHSFVLAKNEVLHFDDGLAGRGLGLSRQTMPRFYQAGLEAGDLLVVCADPPATWNAKMLANSPQLSFDHLRRRLTNDAGMDLQAGIVRFQAGKGQISYWRPGEAPSLPGKQVSEGRQAARHGASSARGVQRESAVQHEPARDKQAVVEQTTEAMTGPVTEQEGTEIAPTLESNKPGLGDVASFSIPVLPETTTTTQPVENAFGPENEPMPAAQETAASNQGVFLSGASTVRGTGQQEPPSPRRVRPERIAQNARIPGSPPETAAGIPAGSHAASISHPRSGSRTVRQADRKPGAFQKGLAASGRKIRLALNTAGRFLGRTSGQATSALVHAIPRQHDAGGRVIPFFNLSSAQMMAIAIFIPLIVVTIATTVYVRSGLTEQFQQRLLKAQQYAQQAAKQKDPALQREGWNQAYTLLQNADKYGKSDESQALKKQIIAALDELENYVRLDYQPAVSGGFPPDVNITRIVTTLNDVYLLDSNQGRILRLYRTTSGYEVDPKFNCGAGTAGTIIINPLIDLAAMPTNNEMHSTVMGIDAGGNLVYCAPNLTGFDSRPLALPDSGWGNIAGITLDGYTLYVLDPKANAVYRYDGTDGVFTDPPHLYFDNTIPQMNDLVDLAVDQEFLYLLHADGRMTICESSGFAFAATKCTDPTPYGDPRPGNDPAPLVFPGSQFTHIQTTQPPDPSLFALDAANKAIYHLSLRRLNLQRQYRQTPDGNFPLPNEAATAFAIAPNRRVLIAFSNKLFFAPLP
jgi:hypothetical protein